MVRAVCRAFRAAVLSGRRCFPGLSGGTRGLPASRSFTSLVDGTTVFQFQPYTANNVLQLSASSGSFGTLTLTTPAAYSSLSLLAAAAKIEREE